MSGFSKLVPEIVMSSVWDLPTDIRIVWITLLALKDADGFVRGSAGYLAKVAKVPLEAVEQAMNLFTSPDPYSRTPDNEGRRVEAVENGWNILNHRLYRDRQKEYQREYHRLYRAKASEEKRKVYANLRKAPDTEEDADSDAEKKQKRERESLAPSDSLIETGEAPISIEEAEAHAKTIGLDPSEVEKWHTYWTQEGWLTKAKTPMSRKGALASLKRWQDNQPRFEDADRLTQARIDAAESIAARDGRNQASTSNLARSGSEAVDRLVSSFRQTVAGIGKGSVYVEKSIRHDSAGLSKADAERLRAGYLAVMGGHPGCVEEDEA